MTPHVAKVREFVFSNPSAKYSPQRTGGYQIVHASPGLSEKDRELIRMWVREFTGGTEDKPHLQSFALEGGDRVVVHLRDLAPDAEYSDRRGCKLAYAVVIAASDFTQAGADPFPWLDAMDVPDSARTIAGRYGPESSRPPEIGISPVHHDTSPGIWDGTKLGDLVALAAAGNNSSAPVAALRGPASDRIRTLRLILKATPRSMRHACTFDSAARPSPPWRKGLWMIGVPGASTEQPPVATIIDAEEGRITGKIPDYSPALVKDLYGRWVMHAVCGHAIPPDFQTLGSQVEEYAAAIQSGTAMAGNGVLDEATSAALAGLWWPEISAALGKNMLPHVGPRICASVLSWLREGITGDSILQLACAPGASFPEALAEVLCGWLLATTPKAADRDWQMLGRLGTRAGNPFLIALAAMFDEKCPGKDRAESVERLNEEAFGALLSHCPDWVDPCRLVSHRHGDLLAEWIATKPLHPAELVAFVGAMLDHGADDALRILTPGIAALPDRWRSKLARLIQELQPTLSPVTSDLFTQGVLVTAPAPWWRKLFRSSRPHDRRR